MILMTGCAIGVILILLLVRYRTHGISEIESLDPLKQKSKPFEKTMTSQEVHSVKEYNLDESIAVDLSDFGDDDDELSAYFSASGSTPKIEAGVKEQRQSGGESEEVLQPSEGDT